MASYISCKMGEVVSLEQGLAINKKSKHLLVENGYPLLRITDMINQRFAQFINREEIPEKFVAKDDDLIFSRTGQVGLIFRNQKGVIHNNCFRITPVDKLERGFLYWFLKQDKIKSYINTLANGSAQPDLNHDAFKSVPISFPGCIKEQKKIANIFDEYDNLIENNNRRIAILEDMAQSLYREWFVKFRYPNYEDYLDADGNPKLVNSPLGKIPEGWEVKRLDDFVTLQRGFDLPKKKRNEKGCVPIYAASGINGYHDQVKAKGPGIVTGRSGTLGIVNLVLEDHWPLNTSLWVKEFKGCTAFYAYYLLDSIGLERFNSGASVPTLNRNDVHGNPVIAPPKELIEKFENIVCVNHKQINLLKIKNKNLKKQIDMLLPKLISGQVEL
ncbi:restriction endonuclease subunit S [Vibrio lentus]